MARVEIVHYKAILEPFFFGDKDQMGDLASSDLFSLQRILLQKS